MAEAKLLRINNQVRFLSRYFLEEDQELIHGAEIYAGYLQDKDFVEQIELNELSRDLLTIQLTRDALMAFFPEQGASILESLVKMLLFDAWVGNNDRHFYNWGVVRHLTSQHPPYFSPIYDTARGLFWNVRESYLVSKTRNEKELNAFIDKYVKKSTPKIGWEKESNLNHLKLVQLIVTNQYGVSIQAIKDMFSLERLTAAMQMLDEEFTGLVSIDRMRVVKKCLVRRHEQIMNYL